MAWDRPWGWGMSLHGIDSEPCRIYLSTPSRLCYLLFLVRIENRIKLFSKTSFNENFGKYRFSCSAYFAQKGFGGSQLPFPRKPVQSTFKATLGRSLDLREKAMISRDSLVMSWLPWVPLTPVDHENGDSASRECRNRRPSSNCRSRMEV